MKRLLALILSLALLCGTLPVSAALPSSVPLPSPVVDFPAEPTPDAATDPVVDSGADTALPESTPAAPADSAAESADASSLPAEESAPNSSSNLPPESGVSENALLSAQPLPRKVTLRIELYDSTFQLPISITLPEQYKPLSEYGLSVKKDPDCFTPLHLLAEYCISLGLDPADCIEVTSTGFVTDFLSLKGTNNLPEANGEKLNDTSFMFAVNDCFPQQDNGMGWTLADYPLTEGDTVVLYDMWYSSGTICGNYSYFSEAESKGFAEDPVAFQLNGFSGMSGTTSSMQGAELLIYDENGNELPALSATATTVGADGTAQIIFAAPGAYLVSAKRLSGYYHSWPFVYAQDISRPYCKVTITEAPQMTDAEAVDYAKKKLSLGDLSAVTENLSLPSTGLRGTAVQWSSNDAALTADGTVTRPVYNKADAQVTLTATITRGTASATKQFSATVKAVTKAEAEEALKDAVSSVSIFISTSLSPGTDNLVSLWQQKLSDKGYSDITVSIKESENPNIAADGSITFNKYYHQNNVTMRFETQGVSYEKQIKYTVNTMSLTLQERVDTVAELLNFDAIKGSNTDPNFITKSPTLPKRMDGYSGVKIDWVSSDTSAISIGSYSISVKRPKLGEADKPVTLTATLKATGASQKTAAIKLVVPAYTTELEVLSASAGTLVFDKALREYTLYLPQNASSIAVTAKPRDTAVTMLRIGSESFRSSGNKEKSATIALPTSITEIPVVVTCSGTDEVTTITVVKDAPTDPTLGAFWGSFRKEQSGNALLISDKTPTGADKTTLRWESSVKLAGALTSYAGSPLIVGDRVYLARENQLLVLDAATGEERGAVPLSAKTGYVAMLAYGAGQIFVPLPGGSIECIDAATLTSLWVSEPLGKETLQALSPVSYLNGKIFCGFYDYGSNSGMIGMIDSAKAPTASGAKRWTKIFGTAGCYGSGAIAAGNHLILADEAGTVRLLGSDATQLDSFAVDSAVRSLPVFAEGAVYLTTTKGTLYRFVIESGALRCTGTASLPESSVAAPVVAGGKVFAVGGSFGGAGFCAVFDAGTLKPIASLRTKGPIQSSPVAVQTAKNDILLYCSENTVAGRLLCFTLSGEELTVQTVYTPTAGNYTTSSPVVTEDGTLLYATDGGTLFALSKAAAPAPTPVPTPTPTPVPGDAVVPAPPSAQATPTPKPAKKKPVAAPKPSQSAAPEKKEAPELLALHEALEQAAPYCTLSWEAGKEIPAELFALLRTAEHCTLVLDFGAYTISFSSDTVKAGTDPVTLSLRSTSLSDAVAAKLLPGVVSFVLEVEGELPGPATIVLPFDESGASLLPLQGDALGAPQAVTVQDGYAMFTMNASGSFVLGTLPEPVAAAAVNSPSKLLPVLAFGGVAAILLTVFVIVKKRGDRG